MNNQSGVFPLWLRGLAICCILMTVSENMYSQVLYGDKRVIFPKEKNILFGLSDGTPYRLFTPDSADVEKADSILQGYFLSMQATKKNKPELEKYYRQYAGVIQNGQHIIYVNASAKKEIYFFQNMYYPKGGGENYFRALIDIKNGRVLTFNFNAPK